MPQSLYTQNIVIKNSNELVKNGKILTKDGYISAVLSEEPKNTLDDPKKIHIITPGFI